MPQPNHHTTSKANFIKSIAADPAGAINSGKLEMQKQEVPFGGIGKAVVKGVAKVAEKVAAKSAEKSTVKALKAVNKPTDKAAKVAEKVESKALKAANKPVKSKDANLMNRNNPQARQAILSEKPANPNVTRGGSAKSKLNWPESMK